MRDVSVILLAGGTGSRIGGSCPKQFLPLAGLPIALHSLRLLASLDDAREIVIVCQEMYKHHFLSFNAPCPILFTPPGTRRQDSVRQGLLATCKESSFICIHDSARPFLEQKDLLRVIGSAKEKGASALAVPVKQTIKQIDSLGIVEKTFDRSHLLEVQTPQVMRRDLLIQGFEIAEKNTLSVTDDLSLVELTGHPVTLILGSSRNIKITTPEDLMLAEAMIRCAIK